MFKIYIKKEWRYNSEKDWGNGYCDDEYEVSIIEKIEDSDTGKIYEDYWLHEFDNDYILSDLLDLLDFLNVDYEIVN